MTPPMRWLLPFLFALPAAAATDDRTDLHHDPCSTGISQLGEAIETSILQAAVEKLFGPADLVSDFGAESVVFRVRDCKDAEVFRIVKVSRFRHATERNRYVASAARQQRAFAAAQESPYRSGARLLAQVIRLEKLDEEIPCVVERDQGTDTLVDHLDSTFVGALFAQSSRAEAVRLVRELARALGALHSGGYVHRDISPKNISIRRYEAHWTPGILDLGLVTRIGERTVGAEEGAGTPGFSRPAQLAGAVASPVDDIYSLGQILKQVVSRMEPGEVRGLDALAEKMIGEEITSIEMLLQELEE